MGNARLKNYVAIVLDRSGSMDTIRQETIDAYNAQIQKIKESSVDQDTSISLFMFANTVNVVYFNASLNAALPLSRSNYVPNGGTALFDGFATAVKMLKTVPDAKNENVSFLVITITDGEENQSQEYGEYNGGPRKIVEMIRENQITDRWTHAFLMPPGAGKKFSARFSVPSDNVREWVATRQGMKEAAVVTSAGIGNYFLARSAGQKSVAAFFHTTDLSKVKREDIRSKLQDISHYFKIYEVPTEARIDEFISGKSKRAYVVGSGYYQLMKKETIQPHKKVLIMEKSQPQIWGGPEARELIGLPSDADAKVTPGNHSNYDIFVQSKAPNRKLPRGTRVIYDPSLTSDTDVTWDYKTAYEEAEKKRQTV